MNYPGTRYTKQMMETVCYPAMEEVAQELRLRGAYVELKSLPPEEGQQLVWDANKGSSVQIKYHPYK